MQVLLDFIESLFARPKKKIEVPKPVFHREPSYYPHWASHDGEFTDVVLDSLEPGTILGVHHATSKAEIRRLLRHKNNFQIAWYLESNTDEKDDSETGIPVVTRITQAKAAQAMIEQSDRFANMCELDAAREKADGNLSGAANSSEAWEHDAELVHAANFSYLAKSPRPSHIARLRKMFGTRFVPRIVYEDVTAYPPDAYRIGARTLAAAGNVVTLIIHEGAYGGFKGTSRSDALAVIKKDFNFLNVEAYHGQPHGAEKLKSFGDILSI